MEYVIPVVVLVLVVAGIVTFVVVRATRQEGPVADRPEGEPTEPRRFEPEPPASERLADRDG